MYKGNPSSNLGGVTNLIMKNLLLIVLLLTSSLFIGCTENSRARQFGGEVTIQVPKGRKVVNASFKEMDLWILTREMRADEQPEILTMFEDSSFGLLNGKVTLIESR